MQKFENAYSNIEGMGGNNRQIKHKVELGKRCKVENRKLLDIRLKEDR